MNDNSSNLVINYLNNIEKVTDGSEVISSGKDGLTPFGMSIGKIYKKEGKFFVVTEKRKIDSIIVKIVTDFQYDDDYSSYLNAQ